MSEVLFYHLEKAGLERVLPGLLQKSLERGWRALVRCTSPATAEKLDEFLWTFSDESFLPHGILTGDQASDETEVLICSERHLPEGTGILFLVDQATAEAEEIAQTERTVVIFDGRSEEALSAARTYWKSLKSSDHDLTYWQQNRAGKWEQKA
ncbi:MAG: DNA polymerase III subunit chi [Pseudomonadota bacterium]